MGASTYPEQYPEQFYWLGEAMVRKQFGGWFPDDDPAMAAFLLGFAGASAEREHAEQVKEKLAWEARSR